MDVVLARDSDRRQGGVKRLASHDLSILGKRERALAQQQVAPGEHVRFCLAGRNGHALIALDRRVVLIKGGSGGRAASFEFSEIGAIRVHTGRTKGSIEIQTSVLGATKAHDFWATNDATDRFKLPNSMPIVTSDLPAYAPIWPSCTASSAMRSNTSRRSRMHMSGPGTTSLVSSRDWVVACMVTAFSATPSSLTPIAQR